MKIKLFLLTLFATSLMITSCDYTNPVDSEARDLYSGSKKSSKHNSILSTAVEDGSYIITEYVDNDPLYKFSLKNGYIVFETNPDVTSWGTDYWGAWADPFEFINNQVVIVDGLTHTTYDFEVLSNGNVDITKTLLVSRYLSDIVDTTITNIGEFETATSGVWDLISFETFESGFGEWEAANNSARLDQSGNYAHEGDNAADLSHNGIIQLANGFDASEYSKIELSLWYYAVSFEKRDGFEIQFKTGSGKWETVKEFNNKNIQNSYPTNPEIILHDNDYNFSTGTQFRIVCDAGKKKDNVYIDEIRINAYK